MKNFEEHKRKLFLWSVLTVLLCIAVFGMPALIIITAHFFAEVANRWIVSVGGEVIVAIVWTIVLLPFINLMGAIFVIPRFISYSTCPYCRQRIMPWVVLKMDEFECPHCHNSRENITHGRKHSWEL